MVLQAAVSEGPIVIDVVPVLDDFDPGFVIVFIEECVEALEDPAKGGHLISGHEFIESLKNLVDSLPNETFDPLGFLGNAEPVPQLEFLWAVLPAVESRVTVELGHSSPRPGGHPEHNAEPPFGQVR